MHAYAYKVLILFKATGWVTDWLNTMSWQKKKYLNGENVGASKTLRNNDMTSFISP